MEIKYIKLYRRCMQRLYHIRLIILFLTSYFLLHTSFGFSQQLLSVDDAVALALKNNYDILVARNDADIAKLNNTAGNAGMLPNVSVSGSDNYSINNDYQKLSGDVITKYQDLSSNSLNAGIFLNWTLFDGGKMFVTKKKLSEIQALGDIQFKGKVQQTVYNVIISYYDVVRQKQELISLNEVIKYNEERVKISQTSFNAGLAPKTDLLQAQIDLNVFRENALNQQTVIISSKRTLNQLLSRETDTPFEVSDSIPLNYMPDKIELSKKLYENNTGILDFQKQTDIAKLSIKEFNSQLLPKLNFDAGYNFYDMTNSVGTLLQNRYYGPLLGGTLTIPVYQSGNASRQINIAKLQLRSSDYNLQSIKLQTNTDLQNALTEFENQKQLLQIEKNNNRIAKENLEISLQRLKQGQTTSLEVSLAQKSFVESYTRLTNFEYNLKLAETKIKQLISAL
jgi:outer membrane protein